MKYCVSYWRVCWKLNGKCASLHFGGVWISCLIAFLHSLIRLESEGCAFAWYQSPTACHLLHCAKQANATNNHQCRLWTVKLSMVPLLPCPVIHHTMLHGNTMTLICVPSSVIQSSAHAVPGYGAVLCWISMALWLWLKSDSMPISDFFMAVWTEQIHFIFKFDPGPFRMWS